jgi:adenylate cyclase
MNADVVTEQAVHPPLPRALSRLLDRMATVGAVPGDTPDERLVKATLVLKVALEASMSTVWVVLYAVLGLPLSAAIPLVYEVVVLGSLVHFARTKRLALFRNAELVTALLLPFLLQWSLGGFIASSAVCVWAFTSPLGALVFLGPARAVPWFTGFVGLIVVSAFLDPHLTSQASEIPDVIRLAFFALNILGVSGSTYAVLQYFTRERDQAMASLALEREKSERLLLNVLPEAIAGRLKETRGIIADRFPDVTVLFADIVGFTPLAGTMEPESVVELLNDLFTRFDALAEQYGLEKIKTIGDAYMVAGGLPRPSTDHPKRVVEMAVALRGVVKEVSAETGHQLAVRIGIDTGPVVAGVIGQAKFSYDLWGDTVNMASRMESHGVPGSIQVTERTYERLRDRGAFTGRGTIPVKGKGDMRTYLLT